MSETKKARRKQVANAVAILLRDHNGVVTRAQLLQVGMCPRAIARRVSRGHWEVFHPGVYRLRGHVISPDQQLRAALLAVGDGAVISHRAAAWLHRLRGFTELRAPEATTTSTQRANGVIVHRTEELPSSHVMTVRQLRVTTPARTILDLAEVSLPEVVADALDDGVRRQIVTLDGLREVAGAFSIRGRRGPSLARALIAERSPDDRLAESALETLLLRLAERRGLPRPTLQYEVFDPTGRFIVRIDFAYPELQIGIFGDGYAFHAGMKEFENDRIQQNKLMAMGWRVLRFTWSRVNNEVDAVESEILAVLELAATSTHLAGPTQP